MSFITQTIGRRATAIIPRVATQAPRFSTTIRLEKGPVEAAKDGLKTVDRAVSDKLVDGIDIAAEAGNKAKCAAAQVTQGNKSATAKAEELKGDAKAAAAKAEGKAKSTAEDIKNKL